MNYFFTFLLQALLPFSLLLGIYQQKSPQVNFKKAIWLSALGVIFGAVARVLLPVSQVVLMINNGLFVFLLILFGLCFFLGRGRFALGWQFIFAFMAGSLWAKDPNIAALFALDVVNTETLLQFAALLTGFFFCFGAQLWIFLLLQQSTAKSMVHRSVAGLGLLLLIALAFPLVTEILLSLMKLQLLELTKWRLSLVAKSAEITTHLNYLCSLILAAILLLFYWQIYRSRKLKVQQSQQAIEKRKYLAALKNARYLLTWGAFIAFAVAATQLYWQEIASKPPQLSEAIPLQLDANKQLHIPIEQVKDGKLHRFVWIADDGKAVRFFVINRQTDKLSLAVVFDACLLCGDQGYVMQDNQVVCVGCGVHMFIPSIGKPGGCNPVPIENWQQIASEILIPRASLEEGLNLFSTIVEIEVQDPISGKRLKNTQSEYKYSLDGKTYFFESEQNLERFRDNPENYLGKGE